MSEKPKRPWFRFHLLTGIVAMLTAGSMLGANVVWRQGRPLVPAPALDSQEAAIRANWNFGHFRIRGWPLRFYERYDGTNLVAYAETYVASVEGEQYLPEAGFELWALLADVAIGLFILIAVTFVSETVIGRRETNMQ